MANKKFKLKREHIVWLIGALFVMSIWPGTGTKALDQQAIVQTDYACSVPSDCPVCAGGLFGINESKTEAELSFTEELSYASCVGGTCRLTDLCIVWECPPGSTHLDVEGNVIPCTSIKQTLLDNTISKMNENPMLFIGGALAIGAFLLL